MSAGSGGPAVISIYNDILPQIYFFQHWSQLELITQMTHLLQESQQAQGRTQLKKKITNKRNKRQFWPRTEQLRLPKTRARHQGIRISMQHLPPALPQKSKFKWKT